MESLQPSHLSAKGPFPMCPSQDHHGEIKQQSLKQYIVLQQNLWEICLKNIRPTHCFSLKSSILPIVRNSNAYNYRDQGQGQSGKEIVVPHPFLKGQSTENNVIVFLDASQEMDCPQRGGGLILLTSYRRNRRTRKRWIYCAMPIIFISEIQQCHCYWLPQRYA